MAKRLLSYLVDVPDDDDTDYDDAAREQIGTGEAALYDDQPAEWAESEQTLDTDTGPKSEG